MNKILKIDEELRDLLPPLSKEEFELLEQNIKDNGCIDPIVIWQGYIIDGHNRYEICNKNNIQFQIIELGFKIKDDVIQWMVETQLGRRNLTSAQRVQIAEKYRPIFKKKAEENHSLNGGNKKSASPELTTPIEKVDVRDELAKIAKVSNGTYSKTKRILDSDNEKVKQEILAGEKKIDTAYNELFGKPKSEKKFTQEIEQIEEKIVVKSKIKKCLKCGLEKPLDEFYIGHDKCKDCEQVLEEKKSKKEINDSIDAIIEEVKTSKTIYDYCDIDGEIEILEIICEELIEQIDIKLFTTFDLSKKMNQEQIDLTLSVLDEHINKINNIKLKLKGEN